MDHEIDGRTFMNEAADAMEPWAPNSAGHLRRLAGIWAGYMPLRIGVATVRGHVSPNWKRLPANLRTIGEAFDDRQIVDVNIKATLTRMLAALLGE